MSVLLIILAFAGGSAVAIFRVMATDELRGHIARRISASVEATITLLPPELQDQWADEWRAEIAAAVSMPLTAALLARGLRRSAIQLIAEAGLAHASARPQAHRSAITRAPKRALAAAVRPVKSTVRRVNRDAIVDGLFALVPLFLVVIGIVVGIGIAWFVSAVGEAGGFNGILAVCLLVAVVAVILAGLDGLGFLVVVAGYVLFGVAVDPSVLVLGLCAVCGLFVVLVVVDDKLYGGEATEAARRHAVLKGYGGDSIVTAEQEREVEATLKSLGYRPPTSS